MPGLDRVIDPVTRDYVGNERTASLKTTLYHQLMGRLDSWVGDPQAGSLLWKLQRGRSNKAEVERAADYVKQAVRPLIEAGLASDLVINITRGVHGWALETSLRDLQSGAVIDLNPLLPYGV